MNVCNFGVRGLKNSKVEDGQSGEIEDPRSSFCLCMHSFIYSTNIYPASYPLSIWQQFLPKTERSLGEAGVTCEIASCA